MPDFQSSPELSPEIPGTSIDITPLSVAGLRQALTDGGLTATKPYVSGAAYINRMSNFCPHCRFDPKKSLTPDACPFTALYWTFLERNEMLLSGNFRLQMPYTTLHRKQPQELIQLRARANAAVAHLQSFKRPAYE